MEWVQLLIISFYEKKEKLIKLLIIIFIWKTNKKSVLKFLF